MRVYRHLEIEGSRDGPRVNLLIKHQRPSIDDWRRSRRTLPYWVWIALPWLAVTFLDCSQAKRMTAHKALAIIRKTSTTGRWNRLQ